MRVKSGNVTRKRHKKILAKTKGMRAGRSRSIRRAQEAVLKAGSNAYKDRKRKKRDFRALWNQRISAGAVAQGLSYSKFIGGLKKANIELDRKVLAEIAAKSPKVFAEIVKKVKK